MMIKGINRRIVILLLPVIAIGVMTMWWIVRKTDSNMRSELLEQARIAAMAVNIDRVSSLSGSKEDLDSFHYRRLKAQLDWMRRAAGECRFLYLMGQRADGDVFFYVDSLPANSEDYAPPGTVYEDVPDSYLQTFDSMKENVVGPVTDRWGTLITALIPVISPHTGNLVAVLGMDIDASAWNEKIIKQTIFPFAIMLLFMGLVTALIAREKAVLSLRRNEEKLRTIIEHSNELFYIRDTENTLTYVSQTSEDIFGYTPEEMMIKWPELATDNPINSKGIQITEKTIKTGEQQNPYLLELKKKDGTPLLFEIDESPVRNAGGEVVAISGAARDVTKRVLSEKKVAQLQGQLAQAQKMEAIGTLAGGIAHDFNNILFGIFGYLEMALGDIPEGSPGHSHLEKVFTAAQRAEGLVKQILAFSRRSEHELKPLQIQLVIKEALKLIKSSLPSTIEISRHIRKDCGLVLADPTQIHQIVMNLCTNAYHAMAETGGKLTITLKEVELTVEDVEDSAMVPGPHVCLTVADTGPGMDHGVMARIFDPYFTTKEKGKGTGLGLAVVHGIVKSHGGRISVYSEPGKGTEFHVYLPVIKKESAPDKIAADSPIQKGTERILLVDDEDMIVQMGREMLEWLGYHVTARTSSIDTLALFRAQPGEFDLVITDMTMPNMTGDKLAMELIRIRPGIPIILCTGFSEFMSKEKAAVLGIKGFLMKPMVMKDLSSVIRKVLDG